MTIRQFSGGGGGGGTAFAVSAVAASGATQGAAAAITSNVTVIITGGSGTGVILTASLPWCDVRNRSGAVAYIYPPAGEQMEGTAGINLPVALPSGSNVIVARDTSPTNPTWRT